MQIHDACDSYISLNNTSFQCWLRINTGFHVFPRGPHVAWQQQLLINICCLWPSSAANPLAAAINWWDRQTDGAQLNWDTHTHSRLMALCPGLPGSAGTRKVKPIWILLKQETVSGSGISCTICKSAPRSRQITTPAPHYSVFTGRMPFLPPNQQRQSTEGTQSPPHYSVTNSHSLCALRVVAWRSGNIIWRTN